MKPGLKYSPPGDKRRLPTRREQGGELLLCAQRAEFVAQRQVRMPVWEGGVGDACRVVRHRIEWRRLQHRHTPARHNLQEFSLPPVTAISPAVSKVRGNHETGSGLRHRQAIAFARRVVRCVGVSGVRILLTNNTLDSRAGSELYVRDLAIELMRRGHHPIAYSTRLGTVAEELRVASVPVVDRLDRLGQAPDLIHGQHHLETMTALLWFPSTPAVYFYHGWLPWEEEAPRFPRILRYVAVSTACREWLLAACGIPPDKIELIFNFYDQRRFPPRLPLPAVPRRALAFGNSFSERVNLPVLREACKRADIELDAAGLGVGQPEANPGTRLAGYDIVFAYGRAAIEALAVGAAVILCDGARVGPLVTMRNFARLRRLNFGLRALACSLDRATIEAEIRRYDGEDARVLSQHVRQTCEMQPVVDHIEHLYEQVLAEAQNHPVAPSREADEAAAAYLHELNQRHRYSELLAFYLRKRSEEAEVARRELERESLAREQQRLIERLTQAVATAQVEQEQLTRELANVTAERERLTQAVATAQVGQAQVARELAIATAERDWLARTLAIIEGSRSWRLTQAVRNHPVVRRLRGRRVRSMAQPSDRHGREVTGGADPASVDEPVEERELQKDTPTRERRS